MRALELDDALISPSCTLMPLSQLAAPLTDADVAESGEQRARSVTRHTEQQGRQPRAHAPVDARASADHDARLCDQPSTA